MVIPEVIATNAVKLWWLSYLCFFIGMSAAAVSPKSKDLLEWLVRKILKDFILGGKVIPHHLERAISKKSGKWTYNAISTVLGVGLGLQVLTYFSMKEDEKTFWLSLIPFVRRLAIPIPVSILNAIVGFYSLSTINASAHDVLLHDDKSAWTFEAKLRHVLFPFDLEMKKVFPTSLSDTQIATQWYTIWKQERKVLTKFGWYALASLGAYKVLHDKPAVWFFSIPTVWFAHNFVLQCIDLALDYVALGTCQNKFEHFFGNNWSIVSKGEAHDFFGKQYLYFSNYGKPIEKFCKKQFYDVARNKYGASVAQAKAAYYLGRGALVLFSLLVLNMVPFQFKTFAAFGVYYGTHAFIAKRNQSRDDWYDMPFKRGLALSGEIILSAYCFYKPVLDHVVRPYIARSNTVGVGGTVEGF